MKHQIIMNLDEYQELQDQILDLKEEVAKLTETMNWNRCQIKALKRLIKNREQPQL